MALCARRLTPEGAQQEHADAGGDDHVHGIEPQPGMGWCPIWSHFTRSVNLSKRFEVLGV
jgi:hypothetical protein